MKVAVLPFNTTEGTKPALGRMFSNFVAETVRGAGEADVQAISYMAQVQEDGMMRTAHVNLGAEMIDYEFLKPLFSDAQAQQVLYGVLSEGPQGFSLEVRISTPEAPEPVFSELHEFTRDEVFTELHRLVKLVAERASVELPEQLKGKMEFGTTNSEAFLDFLEGYDGFQYIQQSAGAVSKEFNPSLPLASLMHAIELDGEFAGPYETAIQLCRACAHFRIGSFEDVESALNKLSSIAPADFKPYAALGEIYQAVGNSPRAADFYEKALTTHLKFGDDVEEAVLQERGALYSRLGVTQMGVNMPVNAERNFRKAVEMEGGERPSLDLLAGVLQQTGREHEVPALWKEEISRNPQHAAAHAKYAAALLQTGREKEGMEAFESALATVDDKHLVKRFFAPVLSEKGEVDRAMDFYEDCLDVNPNDIQLMIEYANTLKLADREFEVPPVLKNILASNPDPNTRAQTLAWLIELEQPKRAEVVDDARKKMETGDFEGAVRDLKPLRNWLADYWKLWALLSSAYNRMEMPTEAEEAAQKLLNLFPGYEPAYGELVNALSTMGKTEEAYNVMRYAANNIPGSLGVHVNLALAAKRAGHDEEARTLAKQIREAIGPNEELEPVLAEIEA
jgi:tetratricopeptide (TPR) repeat protein